MSKSITLARDYCDCCIRIGCLRGKLGEILPHYLFSNLLNAALTWYIAAKAEKLVVVSEGQGMVTTAGNFSYPVHFKAGKTFWLFLCFEIAMAELASVLLNWRAAPGVKVSVLVDSGEVVLTWIDLRRLKSSESRHKLRLVIVSTCHLHNSLIF